MEITDISVHKLGVQLDSPIENSRATLEQRETAIIEVETDSGLTGVGEGYGPNPHIVETTIDRKLKDLLVGKSPMNIEQRWQDMVFSGGYFDQKGHLFGAVSGIDIALWDLLGKHLQTPVYQLLGGRAHQSPQLKTYANMLTWDEPEIMAEIARQYEERGYSGVKFHIGRGFEADRARVRAITSALDEAKVMVDANCGYSKAEAIRVGNMLSEYGVSWYEEPIRPHRADYYGDINSRITVPVASGENEFTKWGFQELLRADGIDFATPSVSRSGGITEVNKICSLAEVHDVIVSPNTFPTGVSLAASMHLIAASPACDWVEWDTSDFPLFEQVFTDSIHPDDEGMVTLPSSPGLGVQISETTLNKYAIE